MTQEEVVARLREKQGKHTLREFGTVIGVSPQYLCDVYKGRRSPGPAILKYLGLRLSYEIISVSPAAAPCVREG